MQKNNHNKLALIYGAYTIYGYLRSFISIFTISATGRNYYPILLMRKLRLRAITCPQTHSGKWQRWNQKS